MDYLIAIVVSGLSVYGFMSLVYKLMGIINIKIYLTESERKCGTDKDNVQ